MPPRSTRGWADLDVFHASEEGRRLAASLQAARDAAVEEGRRLGMEVVVEQDFVPVVVSGRLGEVPFWFRERHGMWRLHRGDHDGPVIADRESESSLVEVVRLIHDRLDRAVRAEGCRHETGGAFCPRCGSRLPPPRDAAQC